MRSDTDPEVLRLQRARIAAMTPGQRVDEGVRLCRSARAVMRAGIRHRHPGYDDASVDLALARLMWGDELVGAAFPDLPLVDP